MRCDELIVCGKCVARRLVWTVKGNYTPLSEEFAGTLGIVGIVCRWIVPRQVLAYKQERRVISYGCVIWIYDQACRTLRGISSMRASLDLGRVLMADDKQDRDN